MADGALTPEGAPPALPPAGEQADDRALAVESREETTAKLIAVLALILVVILLAWLWSMRRLWKHRERSNKVLDEIEMCAACCRSGHAPGLSGIL